jgi:hypothetical protein
MKINNKLTFYGLGILVDDSATIILMNTIRRCMVWVILQLHLRVSKLLYRWQMAAAETTVVKLIVFMTDGTLQSLSLNVLKM